MRTFDSKSWTGATSVKDPIMRDGDWGQRAYWKIRNRIIHALSRRGALKVFDLYVISLFIVAHKAKAYGHLYLGKSWVGGPHFTKQIKFRFPWLGADWGAELNAHYG